MVRSIVSVPVREITRESTSEHQDFVAVEEPLEIRIGGKPLSITMRTPGADRELATGFLFGEGIVRGPEDIIQITDAGNTVSVELRPDLPIDSAAMERNFYMTSSCGICGKASIDNVRAAGCTMLAREGLRIPGAVVTGLPDAVREHQAVFERTGGLHAAALFDSDGNLHSIREDVGRHNAVDKVIGAEFLAGRLPLNERVLFVSGRASFELVQKAVMAQIPVLAAVGAPSSLAVEAARRFQMTLLGFVRNGRFNVYSGEWRVLA